MLPLVGTVFIASLLGSLHCVGMCGPLALLASSSSSSRTKHQRSVNAAAVVAYHGSRVIAYALAGMIVGLLGSGIQETGSLLGLQRLAARAAGGSMLVIGLLGIVRLASGTSHAAMLPAWLQRRLTTGHAWARRQSPLIRASAIGLLTAILPCGWLFAFLIVAAGTAHPLSGAIVMAVFALGAVPALAGMALSMTLLVGKFRQVVPWCSAVLVTIVGAVTLLERSTIDLTPMLANKSIGAVPGEESAIAIQADAAGQTHAKPISPQKLTSQVLEIRPEKLPCCIAAEAAAAALATEKVNHVDDH